MLWLILSVTIVAQKPWDKYNYSPKNRDLIPIRITSGWIYEWGGSNSGQIPIPQLTLVCDADNVIDTIEFASFGNPTGAPYSFQKGSCHAENSTAIVEKFCLGKNHCLIPPGNIVREGNSPLVQIFGDPCHGVVKTLAVQVSGCKLAKDNVFSVSNGINYPLTLSGKSASVVFDFGKEVAGFTTLSFGGASDLKQTVGMAWSESTYYVANSDNSNGGHGNDGHLSTGNIIPRSTYSPPSSKLRGGFRYLHIFLQTNGVVNITNVSLHFTAAPMMEDPSDYKNHFYSSDDLINQVWYGAAYTVQLCSIDPKHGRQWPPPSSGWNNNASCGLGKSVLVDGAKRDRVIWPGDMGVSVDTAYFTIGDTYSTQMSLNTMYKYQTPDGMLPYAGPPVSFFGRSDTYHLWSLIGTINTFSYTSDKVWLEKIWSGFKLGLACSVKKIGKNGLMVVDQRADWARKGQGGENIAANCLLFHALVGGANLATTMGEEALADDYTLNATKLRTAINANILWDESKGAFRDNPTSKIYPQDGNSLAVWFNVTTPNRSKFISDYLLTNWGKFGSSSPEWNMDIGTFPGSMEVNAHMAAGETQRGLNLARLQWGYMLNMSHSTQSTFWEGYHKDGSFAYQGIYMSNSHGWATGVASALSRYVLGIRLIKAGGQNYIVAPQTGDITFCQGRLTFTPGHMVDVMWNITTSENNFNFTLEVDASAHEESIGKIGIPLRGVNSTNILIEIDGIEVWNGGILFHQVPGVHTLGHEKSWIFFTIIQPRRFLFTSRTIENKKKV